MQRQFAPGYRFYPTNQELITFFLDMKIKGQPNIYKNLVSDFDIYTRDPWVIWDRFGGDYLGDEIDRHLGLFFISELKKVSSKKQGSNYVRSVPSGRWHGDTAADPITDSTGSMIGFKKYFVYKNKNPDTEGHDGKWKMHEITSLLDPSSNYVLCQLQKNDKGKRNKLELERKTQAAVSCDGGVHVPKRQKCISDTNQQEEGEQPGFYEPEAKSVCITGDTDFENPIGNSTAITDLTDVDFSLDQLMRLLDEETDACASSETDLKHTIGDIKVIESWKTDIVETEVHTSDASLAVDKGSDHADTVANSTIITDFPDESVSFNETDTCALLETDLKAVIRNSEITESMKTDILEPDVHTSHASLGVDMDSYHADAVGKGSGLAKAYSTACRSHCTGDFFTDSVKLIAEDPQFASRFLLPGSDTMLPGFYNMSWVDS